MPLERTVKMPLENYSENVVRKDVRKDSEMPLENDSENVVRKDVRKDSKNAVGK